MNDKEISLLAFLGDTTLSSDSKEPLRLVKEIKDNSVEFMEVLDVIDNVLKGVKGKKISTRAKQLDSKIEILSRSSKESERSVALALSWAVSNYRMSLISVLKPTTGVK